MGLESDKTALEGRIEFFGDVQRFSQDVLGWLDNDAEVDQGLLLASFYAAEVWPLTPNTSTYPDLHSTGNIRLLDEMDLKSTGFPPCCLPVRPCTKLSRAIALRKINHLVYLGNDPRVV